MSPSTKDIALIERLEDLNKTLSRIANNFELYLSLYVEDLNWDRGSAGPIDIENVIQESLRLKETIRDVRIQHKKGHKNGNR